MSNPAEHSEFHTRWQALMHQLETVLSRAHRREHNRTEWREAISIAKYELDQIEKLGE